MSDCCGDHGKHKGGKTKEDSTEKLPKSFLSKAFKDEGFIGKYLYNLGKKDLEKEKQGGKRKGGCY